MNSYNCSNCKKQVNENDKFCPHCGAPVIADSPETKSTIQCPKCNHESPEGSAFCEKCGTSLTETGSAKKEKSGPQTFSSAGNYSGKMTRGKTSKGWKKFRNILIALIVAGIIALIIWFQVDPDAGEKLTNFGVGLLIVAIFIFFIIRGSKKGRSRGSGRSFYHHNNSNENVPDNDDNRDDDFDDGDDGGDDD